MLSLVAISAILVASSPLALDLLGGSAGSWARRGTIGQTYRADDPAYLECWGPYSSATDPVTQPQPAAARPQNSSGPPKGHPRRYSTAERKNADVCADYLNTKRPYLDYAHALDRGWPIATGVIEGACRHLVKDRMDITGARWGLDRAEAILTLRALVANGDFDHYRTYHLDREHQRDGIGHQSDYTLTT